MTNIVTTMMMAMLIIMLLAMMVICSNSHSSELSFLFNIVIQSLVFTRYYIDCCSKAETHTQV